MMKDVMVLTEAQAWEEMVKYEDEVRESTVEDVIVYFQKKGLPQEVIMRLVNIYEKVKKVGGKIIPIGKVIIARVIEFIEAHPKMLLGMALGAALGALAFLIPAIGGWLGPYAMEIGAILGGIAGGEMDTQTTNAYQLAIAMAKEMFEFFANVINCIYREVVK